MFTFRVDVAAAEFGQRLQFYQWRAAHELGAAATGPVVFVFTSAAASSQRYCYDRCECCSSSDGCGTHLSLYGLSLRASTLRRYKMVKTTAQRSHALQPVNRPQLELCLFASALQR